MQKVIVALLVAVVGLLGVIAWALLRPEPTDEEKREARRVFEDRAELYCTLDYYGSLDDPQYLNCVDRRVELKLTQWENAGRPSPESLN